MSLPLHPTFGGAMMHWGRPHFQLSAPQDPSEGPSHDPRAHVPFTASGVAHHPHRGVLQHELQSFWAGHSSKSHWAFGPKVHPAVQEEPDSGKGPFAIPAEHLCVLWHQPHPSCAAQAAQSCLVGHTSTNGGSVTGGGNDSQRAADQIHSLQEPVAGPVYVP